MVSEERITNSKHAIENRLKRFVSAVDAVTPDVFSTPPLYASVHFNCSINFSSSNALGIRFCETNVISRCVFHISFGVTGKMSVLAENRAECLYICVMHSALLVVKLHHSNF
jgi:hypothetical protein